MKRSNTTDSFEARTISPALVVDGSYPAAVELSRLLDEWNIETRCAGRIATARELARRLEPRLALVDTDLSGGFEGLDLGHEMQALYRTKIVFVTGHHARDLMHRLGSAESMAVLFKPVARDALSAVLAKVCVTINAAH